MTKQELLDRLEQSPVIAAVQEGADITALAALPVRERIGRAKSIPYADFQREYAAIEAEMDAQIAAVGKEDRK